MTRPKGLQPLIVSVLPYKDHYTDSAYGAVSLCVSEFIQHSRYSSHLVLGKPMAGTPLQGGTFIPIHYVHRWYQSQTKQYATACLRYLSAQKTNGMMVEVHNRPQVVRYFLDLPQTKVALFFHNDPLTMAASKTKQQRQWLLSQCDVLYFNSDYIQRRFFQGLSGISENMSKCVTQYQGVLGRRVSRLRGVKQRQCVFVGRLIPAKGAGLLVQAALQVLPHFPQWRVVFIVPRPAKPTAYSSAFYQACQALGPQCEVIDFLPHAEVLSYFEQSAMACLPSTWDEPFGRVVLEAMAMGCACITSRRGGIPEIVGEAGYLLTDVAVEDIVKAMQYMMQDDEVLRQYQQCAVKRVRQYFDLSKQALHFDRVRDSIWSVI